MAYVFGKLNNLIGQNDQGRQQGQNVPLEKRVGTDSASGGPGATSKSPEDFSKSTFQNAGAILERNKNVDTGAIQNRIEQPATQKLNQEFGQIQKDIGDYTNTQQQAIKSTYKPVSQQIVEQGVSGDQSAGDALRSSLNPQKFQASQFQTVTPQKIGDLQGLTQGDSSQTLTRLSSGPYSQGMAALDSLVFQKSGGAARAAQNIANLQNRNQQAVQSAQGLGSQFEQQAAGEAQAQKDQTTTALKQYLDRLRAQDQSELNPLISQAQTVAQNRAFQEATAPYQDKYTAQGSSLPFDLAQNVRTPVNVNQEELKRLFPNGIVSQEDADKYRRINEFLGTGGELPQVTALDPNGDNSGLFDTTAYKQALAQRANDILAAQERAINPPPPPPPDIIQAYQQAAQVANPESLADKIQNATRQEGGLTQAAGWTGANLIRGGQKALEGASKLKKFLGG